MLCFFSRSKSIFSKLFSLLRHGPPIRSPPNSHKQPLCRDNSTETDTDRQRQMDRQTAWEWEAKIWPGLKNRWVLWVCKKRPDDLFSSNCVYVSLNQLLYRHLTAQVKLKLQLRERIETLGSNQDLILDLDQRAGMEMGIIICDVRGTSASTLYATVVLSSYAALCSIISS